jgi:inositol-phosphate phosphatase/L-galactose 1-phosphate phosphatase/histidinol-phosphatase
LHRQQQSAGLLQQQQQQQLQQQPHLQFLQLAHDLADAAGLITTQYFRTKLNVDSKSDASPVTIADRQAEEAMRKLIAAACPSHAVFGEEHGLQLGSNSSSGDGNGRADEWLWVLDPIDGTKSFITGGFCD